VYVAADAGAARQAQFEKAPKSRNGVEFDAVGARHPSRRPGLRAWTRSTSLPSRGCSRSNTRGRPATAGIGIGSVEDPATVPVRANLRFGGARIGAPRRWWNGLLYSRWQLLDVPLLRRRIAQAHRERRDDGSVVVRLPAHDANARAHLAERRRWAMLLTGIDARYLPLVDGRFVHLTNTDVQD